MTKDPSLSLVQKRSISQLGISAICIGLVSMAIYFIGHFYVSYYSAIGIRESASSFGLAFLLFVGGVTLFFFYRVGESLILGFIIGNLLDRLLVLILYYKYATIGVFVFPLISSLIMGVIWYYHRTDLPPKNKYLVIVLMIAIVIIIAAKLVYLFISPIEIYGNINYPAAGGSSPLFEALSFKVICG